MHRIVNLIVAAALLLSLSPAAWAVDPTYTEFFSNKAIRGYDSVAYFTQGKAVEGKEQFTTDYNEAQWLFSSQEHLDLFKQNPQKYAPQYGGYCAYAVSKNSTASTQPDLFTIVDDKLYLNYSKGIQKKWLADTKNFIRLADQNWPGILAD
ncbi:MAG: YHS domain-containing protein [Gammaproteobacteria bacterium]|nr:YHS domain-containing protein [Gammaproteobacteria bacterium]